MKTLSSLSTLVKITTSAVVVLLALSNVSVAEEKNTAYSDNVLLAMVDTVTDTKQTVSVKHESASINHSANTLDGRLSLELDRLISQRLDALLYNRK